MDRVQGSVQGSVVGCCGSYSSKPEDEVQAAQLIANCARQPNQQRPLLDAGVLRALISLTSNCVSSVRFPDCVSMEWRGSNETEKKVDLESLCFWIQRI